MMENITSSTWYSCIIIIINAPSFFKKGRGTYDEEILYTLL